MRRIQTEVLVIGGGATGTGIVRDLAMRGFKTILIEQRDLNHGTTGRFHGLLHSGGRYVVKDPSAAKECIEENRILRKIMPHCLEDAGGFFVLTPWDDINYVPQFVTGCQLAGIPIEEVSITQMLREEPRLNPNILQCFRLPDATADSFLASELNVESAKLYGATILNYCEAKKLLRQGNKVIGGSCYDLIKDEELEIFADIVVNAAGAWSGRIARTIGVDINIIPGKGTMVALNHRFTNTVINRCKMPSDGDILVPIHTICVIGTTDIRVEEPDHLVIEPWEIRLLLDEGEKLVPGLKAMRVLRCWAGVRPLYQESELKVDREISRAFALLDHEQTHGIANFITITSGKWTTYRLMAQSTVDLICKKLNTNRPCRTHLEPLPTKQNLHYHTLGKPLQQIEENENYGQLICECELATKEEIINSIVVNEAKSFDDIRRETRLGMGPCQGTFCTYRVAGIYHQIRHPPIEDINMAIRDFLQERWKGVLPILWGQQLRQERLKELVYVSLLHVNRLPGKRYSKLMGKLTPLIHHAAPDETGYKKSTDDVDEIMPKQTNRWTYEGLFTQKHCDVLIIGAGLAGLIAAWQLSNRGIKTHVITKGWGATYLHTGCIDVLGYHPVNNLEPLESPREGIIRLIHENTQHPYALVGEEVIEAGLNEFLELCNKEGYPFLGSIDSNYLLPTAMGAIRPTCLVPTTMVNGDLRKKEQMIIVGFSQFRDFYPELVAENLSSMGNLARSVSLDVKALHNLRWINPVKLAQCFENEEFCEEIIKILRPKLSNASRIGFPAVLGIRKTNEIVQRLENELDIKVFEVPTIPPSIPGIRLHHMLVRAIEQNNGRIYSGMDVFSAQSEDAYITKVWSKAAARSKCHIASKYILATGGILGGGFICDPDKRIREPIFGLPIEIPKDPNHWLEYEFLSPTGHKIFRSGVRVNHTFQPLDENGNIIYKNLYAIGTLLGQCDVLREYSFEGVALSTGYRVGKELITP